MILFLGIGLMDWRFLVAIALFFALLFMFGLFIELRNQRYARLYPVFSTDPTLLATGTTGHVYHLHIARVHSGFIIGISYEEEIDGTPRTTKTRWKMAFPTYELAEAEVIKRCQDLTARHGTPNPSIERTSPGKPGAASHVKR